ncbi:MAG TPA: DUF309 domain-containing protein [Limnochordales bacterium]
MVTWFGYEVVRQINEERLRWAERERLARQALRVARSREGNGRLARTSGQGPIRWPPSLVRFVELVNAGRFWHAHEALEEAWRVNKSDFYHGLIIYASAYVHAQRGNPRGVVLQMAKVPRYLSRYPAAYLGFDVAAILRDVEETRQLVQRAGMPEGDALRAVIRWPSLALDPARCSGAEPELTTA